MNDKKLNEGTQHGSLHAPEIPDPPSVSMGCMVTSPPPCSLCEAAEAVQGADVVITPTKPATGKSTKIIDGMEALPPSPRANKTAADYFKSPSNSGESETPAKVCGLCKARYFFEHVCLKAE